MRGSGGMGRLAKGGGRRLPPSHHDVGGERLPQGWGGLHPVGGGRASPSPTSTPSLSIHCLYMRGQAMLGHQSLYLRS